MSVDTTIQSRRTNKFVDRSYQDRSQRARAGIGGANVRGPSRHLVRCSDMSGVGSKPDSSPTVPFRLPRQTLGLEPLAVCMERLLFALVFSHGARSNSRRGWSQDGAARQWSFATAAERSTTMRNDFHPRTDVVNGATNQMRRRSGVPSARRRDSGDCCARR